MGRKGSGVEVRDKSIRLSFTVAGKQHRHTLKINAAPAAPTPGNIRYAHQLAQQIRDAIARGTFKLADFFPDEAPPPVDRLTVEQYLTRWLAAQRIESTTHGGYTAAVRFWCGAPCDDKGGTLGALPLADLRAQHINTAMASRPELNGSTLNNYRARLSSALRDAAADGLAADGLMARVKRAAPLQQLPDPFTPEELERILQDLSERAPAPVFNLVEWWAFTGVRTGEALGLKWPQVDLASGYFQVQETRVRGEHRERTKTNRVRQVLMNSRARAAIERQRAHSQAAGGYVWTMPDGEPIPGEYTLQRRWWASSLKRLGIRYRQPYNLRHTYATTLLMAGVNPAFAAQQLGHSIELFLNTYSRWIGGDANAREMSRIEAALGAPGIRKTG